MTFHRSYSLLIPYSLAKQSHLFPWFKLPYVSWHSKCFFYVIPHSWASDLNNNLLTKHLKVSISQPTPIHYVQSGTHYLPSQNVQCSPLQLMPIPFMPDHKFENLPWLLPLSDYLIQWPANLVIYTFWKCLKYVSNINPDIPCWCKR